MDLECQLVEMFHWSLHEIDETDVESLIPFVFHYPEWKAKQKTPTAGTGARQVYADEAAWL